MNHQGSFHYAIVTPAKNEAENMPRLVDAIARQTIPPKVWVLVNDSSTDNTVETFRQSLSNHPELANNCNTVVISHEDSDTDYALGEKYSRVVRSGLQFLSCFSQETECQFEYVGVLDSDVFPEATYYEKLRIEFSRDTKLGIASAGTQYEEQDGQVVCSRVNRTHTPGGFRMWRTACLKSTGYDPTVSQDAVSEARAIMQGWRVRSFPQMSVNMRKRGLKFGYEYYGRSAYIRWVPQWYVMLGSFRLLGMARRGDATAYRQGYLNARRERIERIRDPIAKRYFRYRILYRLIGK